MSQRTFIAGRPEKRFARFTLFWCFAILILCLAHVGAADDLPRREWKIDGVTREALVHIPADAKTNAAPIVFAFHGHGGSMQNAARMFHIQTIWPEAIVVYMQGLNTPGRLTDPEGKKPGWQHGLGAENDRDLKFFDAVYASLKKDYKVDTKRVYSTGHSNGGGFTYLLWEARGKEFAAFAPSAAVGRALAEKNPAFAQEMARRGIATGDAARNTNQADHVSTNSIFKPKPVLHVAGENDPLVKFTWQKMMMEALRKLNQCGEGTPWEKEKECTIYESRVGAPVVTYIHPGTHKYPEEAPRMIVKFFKQQAQR
ncbi:MAG: prolyl oligopeptidase family serine peptidase [Verrucomicrobiota bacterium]